MRIFFFLLAILIVCPAAFAQTNYTDLQSEITAVCGVPSYDSVVADKEFLDSLNVNEINVGLEDFLLDKAWVYYLSYGFNHKKDDLKESWSLFERCWEEFQNKRALYNLIVLSRIQNNCEKLDSLSNLFKEKFSDLEDVASHIEIKRMREECQ
ncbi:hypothetical protein [Halocola ammonii]